MKENEDRKKGKGIKEGKFGHESRGNGVTRERREKNREQNVWKETKKGEERKEKQRK